MTSQMGRSQEKHPRARGASERIHRISVALVVAEEERGPPRCLDCLLAACCGCTPRRMRSPLALLRRDHRRLRGKQPHGIRNEVGCSPQCPTRHVFTANMTGNVVFLSFALVGKGTASVPTSLLALGSFAVGALVGGRTLKALSSRSVRLAFGVEVATLLLATLLGFVVTNGVTGMIVALLAFAMGLRNAVVRKLAVPDMTTTVLTLTVTGLAADSSLAGGTNPRWKRRGLAVLMMIAGAALGAALLPFGVAWVVAAAAALEGIAVIILARNADVFEADTAAP